MKMKKIFILSLAVLLSLLIIGISYAHFSASAQSTTQYFSTGDFSFTLTEDGGKLNLASSYPLSDSEGIATNPYTFSVTNTGDIDANYQIILNISWMVEKSACYLLVEIKLLRKEV